MSQTSIKPNKLAQGLASPDYCLLLHKLGCTQRTAFVWLHKNDEYIPFTYEFDPDHYYALGDQSIMEVAHYTQIPAYSTDELKRVFDAFNFTLAKEGNQFQLEIDGKVGKSQVHSVCFNNREADVFAAVLISLLQKNILPIAFVNEQIRHD